MLTLAHIFYSGTVQGVGFRYTVKRLAADLKLKGWVRNSNDGRVEMAVEGEQKTVDELLKRIDERYEGCIRDKRMNWGSPREEFQDFEIRFY